MEDSVLASSFTLQVDNGNIPYLAEAAKWGKFLSVFGFIIIFLILISGCYAIFITGSSNMFSSEFQDLDIPETALKAVIIFYVMLFFVITFFPCLYLYNFSAKAQTAIKNNDQISLNKSFSSLKSLLKFWGVLSIIMICIWVVGAIFGLLAGLA